ncbi:protein mesh [Panulirus ornatus]|uniref:protein mesh n=1 Tax=Panulirus ornatus TaxID=150431 RepID=UPI003A86D932
MLSRIAPVRQEWQKEEKPYAISAERLKDIRSELMYPFFDVDSAGGTADLEPNINTQNSQVNKQLNFLLPFFGFGLNYTWVSLNGYLGFSDAPFNWDHYPLSFPVPEWPTKPDPSFIGPFYSKCNIGALKPGDDVSRRPGVYWRLERDLPSRQDQFGVEIRERIKWDVREGIVGATIFNPKHIIIVTWKNLTFAGGSLNTDAKYVTNTFQLVVATDEIRTYCLFNYQHMSWTSHTEAGGSTDEGQGGVPAYVGFNAGNGTRAYEYTPYSQKLYIRDLAQAGNANGMPGRHIFRIDEKILAGCCRREEELKEYPLTFSPEQGNMMGGTLVNLTGPCFKTSYRLTCQFDRSNVEGVVLDDNRAACIMPSLYVSGYVDFSISINGGPYYWKGKFFVETPLTAPEGVWFKDDSFRQHSPESLEIEWLAGNLTLNKDAQVIMSLWGYREISITPEIVYIDSLVEGTTNTGTYTLTPAEYASRDNWDKLDLEMGFIMINLTTPEPQYRLKDSTVVWSRPIPLAWYFHFQWERLYGKKWPIAMCDRWVESDRNLRNFAYEVERCPCLLKQAVSDKGRFLPDFSCDRDGNTKCDYHDDAIHCVRTALPNKDGAGQQCCYDRDGYLMMTADKIGGGNPHRAHNLGKTPFDEANKVPSLSHWYHDVVPYYTCCRWQGEQSPGCVTYRFERRASQDCVGYQPPTAATVFGDPHIYTFDDFTYTFNGKGEFVLVRVDSVRHVLDIQGRFEQIDENYLDEAKASMLTAVAARDNVSSVVEVRRRPSDAMWRYHLDVLVDGQRVYFDRYSQKIQQFRECVVYTPSNILNQSHVVIMFASGAGVEVMENMGYLGTRIYLPLTFANITRGLFGNWTFDPQDDFVLPDGMEGPMVEPGNLELIHKEFAMKWVLDDKESTDVGKSLFFHENSRSSNYYYDATFEPEWKIRPDLPLNAYVGSVSHFPRVCVCACVCVCNHLSVFVITYIYILYMEGVLHLLDPSYSLRNLRDSLHMSSPLTLVISPLEEIVRALSDYLFHTLQGDWTKLQYLLLVSLLTDRVLLFCGTKRVLLFCGTKGVLLSCGTKGVLLSCGTKRVLLFCGTKRVLLFCGTKRVLLFCGTKRVLLFCGTKGVLLSCGTKGVLLSCGTKGVLLSCGTKGVLLSCGTKGVLLSSVANPPDMQMGSSGDMPPWLLADIDELTDWAYRWQVHFDIDKLPVREVESKILIVFEKDLTNVLFQVHYRHHLLLHSYIQTSQLFSIIHLFTVPILQEALKGPSGPFLSALLFIFLQYHNLKLLNYLSKRWFCVFAVVSCGALPTPPNGRKSTFNFLSGAEVKFDCDPGYVLLGEQRRWCYASGDWNWPEDGEATCVSEAEYLVMQQGITTGTVLAVLLPILIALLCYVSYHRSKRQLDMSYGYQPAPRLTHSPAPRPVISRPIPIKDPNYSPVTYHEEPILWKSTPPDLKLTSEAPLHRARYHSSTNSSNSTSASVSDSASFTYSGPSDSLDPLGCRPMKVPKHFDGDYDTHEPLDDQPVIFQNVLWELDEVSSKETDV